MYNTMLETQPATGGPKSSERKKEEEERSFHNLTVDTKKLFLCKSESLSVYPGKQGYTA